MTSKGEVYFDESALPTFQDWIADLDYDGSKVSKVNQAQDLFAKSSEPTESAKTGLGYKEGKSKFGKNNRDSNVVLLNHMRKAKKKRDDTTTIANQSPEIFHGIMEEETELSRTSIGGKSLKPTVNDNSLELGSKRVKTCEQMVLSISTEDEISQINMKPKKRPKKRSKQKNIRKDNRPDDKKPSYLVATGSSYRGHPLTKVFCSLIFNTKLYKIFSCVGNAKGIGYSATKNNSKGSQVIIRMSWLYSMHKQETNASVRGF